MFKAILVPIDISEETSWQHALPQAIELARDGGASLTVFTVVRGARPLIDEIPLPLGTEDALKEARQRLETIVAGVPHHNVAIRCEVGFGSVSQEILDFAQSRSIDLILMTSHRPGLKDYLIGAVAAFVAQHATCSVLVLRKFG